MDFTEIDSVINKLEKKLSTGSPPVVIDGTLALWRTVRGWRVALELLPGDGRYNFGGKKYKGGRVMVGPPSLMGQDINDVDKNVWGKLSGTGTRATFGEISPDQQAKLKKAIKVTLGEDDTRHAALDKATKGEELINLARSAGFTDEEIQQALDGKEFQNELDKPDKDKPAKPTPIKPAKPSGGSGGNDGSKMVVGGENLDAIAAALKIDGVQDADKKRQAADRLLEAAKGITTPLFRLQVEQYAYGLKSGDYTLAEVRASVVSLLKNRKDGLLATLSPEEMARLQDKSVAKPIVRELQEQLASAQPLPSEPDVTPGQVIPFPQQPGAPKPADMDAVLDKLEILEQQLNDQKVAQQVKALRVQARSQRLGGNSVILRLLQILRFILAFVPG